MNNTILVIATVLKIIYERICFPHSVPNVVIISKKDGSDFPKNMLNSWLNIDWKLMSKDCVMALGSLMPSTPLIRLQAD